MARFDFDIPDDLFKGLGDRFDTFAPKMIDAALPLYADAIKRVLAMHSRTGGLVSSVGIKKAKKTKTDAYVGNVVFKGSDEKGHPNVVKAAGLEYGNSHQTAKPFIQSAASSCEAAVLKTMTEVLQQEVDSL